MGHYRITHTRKDGRDPDRRIDAVKIGNEIFAIDTIIVWIERREHSFEVVAHGRAVRVLVGRHAHGRKYLTTEGDGFPPNNLLSLPDC